MSIFILEPNGKTNTAKYVSNIIQLGVSVYTSNKSSYDDKVSIPVFARYQEANGILKFYYYLIGLFRISLSIPLGSILHFHWLKFSPLDTFILWVLKKNKIKLVGTVHNILPHEQKPWDYFFYKRIYSLADVLVFHSEGIYKKFIRKFGQPKKHIIIHHYYDKVTINRDIENSKYLLFFGNIRPYKGLELLLSALESIPLAEDCKLIIAGKPEYNIDGLIQSMNGTVKIEWKTYYIDNNEVEYLFNLCGVVVMPYLKIDTSGLLYLAKSYGKVIVAPDMGIFQEEIINGVNGILFDPKNGDDLAKAIKMAMTQSIFEKIKSTINQETPENSLNVFRSKHHKLYDSLI